MSATNNHASAPSSNLGHEQARAVVPEPQAEEEGREEPVSGFLAFQALGVATAVVFGSAGLGAWVVAKLLGVNDVRILHLYLE
jgi:hypothetical protein